MPKSSNANKKLAKLQAQLAKLPEAKREIQRLQAEISTLKADEPAKPDQPSPLGWLWDAFGAVGLFGGFGLMQDDRFLWWGVGAIYLGFGMIGIHGWFTLKTRRLARLLPVVFLVLLGGGFTYQVFQPMPLQIIPLVHDTLYPADTEIGGIKWDDKYTDVRVTITNTSEYDYHDINLRMSLLPAVIANVGQVQEFPGVTLFPGMMLDIRDHTKTPSGDVMRTPVEGVQTSSAYFLRVDTLPPRASAFVVVAAMDPNWVKTNRRPSIGKIALTGTYRAGGRLRRIEESLDGESATIRLPGEH